MQCAMLPITGENRAVRRPFLSVQAPKNNDVITAGMCINILMPRLTIAVSARTLKRCKR